MPMVAAQALEAANQGLQSHRHLLGKQRAFVPTLLADQEQKQYAARRHLDP